MAKAISNADSASRLDPNPPANTPASCEDGFGIAAVRFGVAA